MTRTGLSRGGVQKGIAALREAGWLTVVVPARQHRTTRYRLAVPAQALTLCTSDSSPGAPLDNSDAHLVTPDAHLMTPGAHTVGPTSLHTSLHDLSDDLSEGEPSLSDEDRSVAETRARQTGLRIDVVVSAVAKLRASKDIGNMSAYLGSIDKAGLERLAGVEQSPPRSAVVDEPGETCGTRWHVKGGMRIHGTGAGASRACSECEAQFPAAQAATPVHPPARATAEAAS